MCKVNVDIFAAHDANNGSNYPEILAPYNNLKCFVCNGVLHYSR